MSAKVYEVVTDRILEKLKAGVVPWRKPWSGSAGLGECKNIVSGKPYRGINAFLTAVLGYRSPYFMTYKQAVEHGAHVRAGEKGIPIVYFRKLDIEDATTGKEKSIPMMRYYTVFNVEQVEGLKIREGLLFPGNEHPIEFKPIEEAERIAANMPARPRLVHEKQSAFYSPMLDYVNMPKPESFGKAEEYYSTLFHELTHATGHKDRLDRGLCERLAAFGSADYSKEELVAEMGSAFLCAKAGIDAPVIDNQAAYISNWLRKLQSDPAMVVKAAGQAQKAADFILNAKA